MPYDLTVNGQHQSVDADPSTPLLWVLRDHLGMTGTKYGCGIAQCGACTVHIDGNPTRSCQVPLESAAGASVTTIEGLSQDFKSSAAATMGRDERAAVRLLPVRHADGGGGVTQEYPQPDRHGYRH